jgi:hypothetical protein
MPLGYFLGRSEKKTTKIVHQDSNFPGRELNTGPQNYEEEIFNLSLNPCNIAASHIYSIINVFVISIYTLALICKHLKRVMFDCGVLGVMPCSLVHTVPFNAQPAMIVCRRNSGK